MPSLRPARPDPAGPLSIPAYRDYWYSRLGATLGAQVQLVAVGWQMYDLTDSALALGLVQFLPSVPLLFVVGPIVDRHDRRAILAGCRLAQALATLALAAATFAGRASPELLFGFVFILGMARAFEMPASQSLLPTLVPVAMLSRAVALSSSAHQAATIVGPALGGFLYMAGAHVVYATSGRGSRVCTCSPASPSSAGIRSCWVRSRSTCSRCCSVARPRCCRSMRATS